MAACGLDFGTSNTALALVQGGASRPLVLDPGHSPPENIPTLLFFSEDHRQFYGSQAVDEYLERAMAGRFVQSIKRHLPSRAFTHTFVNGRAMDLSDLIAGFLEHLRLVAEAEAGEPVTRALMGRPAVFHEDASRDKLAQDRLEQAARMAGFEDVLFRYEPIAAARSFESELDREVLCLVGDLGGGTSDFTVMRLGPDRVGRPDRGQDVLGADGVNVAGNDFDAVLVKKKVLPRLGFHATWRPLGRPVPVPTRLHMAMTSWHALSFVNTAENLAELEGWIRSADDAVGLKRLHEILDWNLGFELFRAVEACKVELSKHDEGVLSFRAGKLAIEEPVFRHEFESAAKPLTDKLGACMDGLLTRLELERSDIGAVFLTGGTSLVPCVRRLFEERFPGRLLAKDVFTSVGHGLGVEVAEVWG
ncbi:MAG: Hsp70 family protein [Proteobacteria bacterium]|nr:Hsp70 family protein [Pseudomonadota bacterium]MCP4915784.1 Hsp70 family protein [Pseudomonadota bacterium]